MVNAMNEEIKFLYKMEYKNSERNITKEFNEISNFKWTNSDYNQIRKKIYYFIKKHKIFKEKEYNLSNMSKMVYTAGYLNGNRTNTHPAFSVLCKYLNEINGKIYLNRDYYE